MVAIEEIISANILIALIIIIIDVAIYLWLQHTHDKAAHYYWQEVGIYLFMFCYRNHGCLTTNNSTASKIERMFALYRPK